MITHSISLIGKRNENEDEHDIIVNLDKKDNELHDINYFGVYDGHGGKDVSKFLKKYLSNYFTASHINHQITDSTKFKKYIENVYKHLQKKLELRYKNFSYNIGSTALVSIFYKKNNKISYFVINVGDCRAVLCNSNNIAIPLSKDHKPNSNEEKKRIEKLGGEIEFDGFDWRISGLSVSRAFGDMDAKPYVDPDPDIYKYNLKTNDKFIILACDGLWDVISNQEAVDFVLNKLDDICKLDNMSGYSVNNIAHELGKYAIKKGSTDNISMVIAFF